MFDWLFHYLRRGVSNAIVGGVQDAVQRISDAYEQRVADGEIEIQRVGYLEDHP